MAGVVSHPMDNVLWKIALLCEGDPVSQFGLSGVDGLDPVEVLALVAEASGFDPDPATRWGPVRVMPEPVLRACQEVGDRLALACQRGERVILATGHPPGPTGMNGLLLLYQEVGRMLERRGVRLLTPRDGFSWKEPGHRRRKRTIGFMDGVAVVTDGTSMRHSHSSRPMELIFEEARPDLVFADHGFAGAAIEAGIDTVSIADVNDPALLVAKAQGRTGTVVVMDDNVRRQAYWPCFQAIAARLP
jgi:Phosphatase